MSVAAVARKDFRDGIRSRLLWGLIALFVVSIAGFSVLATRNVDGVQAEGELAILFVLGLSFVLAIVVLVPLTGLVVSIKSIVRERELGSLKILLSLPHSRGEVIVGKFLGRSALLTTAILAGFLPAGLVFAIRVPEFPVPEYLAFTLVTVLFGIVFVAVGLGISALVSTETRATVAGVGAFFLLYLWDNLFGYVNAQLDLLSGDALTFVLRFDLFTVFFDVLLTLFSLRYDDVPSASAAVSGQLAGGPEVAEIPAQPFYLQHWFALVILALWIAVPVAIGYLRFERADL